MTSSELSLLLMASLVAWLVGFVESYVVDIIVKQKPKATVCWTCPKRITNELCNKWAPNKPCPTGYTLCQTVHRINTLTGHTMFVHKRCALPSECGMEMIGCHGTSVPGIEDCISCCNYAYCNEHSPSNQSAGVQYSVLTSSGSTNSPIHRSYVSVKLPCVSQVSAGIVNILFGVCLYLCCLFVVQQR